jgi:leucyl/phenylalanyl-tRNA---protein transferase
MLPWLMEESEAFPSVETALLSPNGLLAVTPILTLSRLKQAYSQGIFPWYSPGEPVLWWSPDPRMVLRTTDFKCHRSLRQVLKKQRIEIRVDTCFERVMRECAQMPRWGQAGTWIVEDIIQTYTALHREGFAHSIEAWEDEHLVGGLYGVHIGTMFFGESMFSRVPNASKVALAYLVQYLERFGMNLIDCQQETPHLASLGGRPIPRKQFIEEIRGRVQQTVPEGMWLINA